MEGVWQTERGAPLLLFALPDEEARTNRLEIGIPHGASLILTHDWNGEIRGLNEFEHHPPVAPLFFGFRVMVGVGLLMLAVSWVAVWQMRKGREPSPWLARGLVAMTFSGWLAPHAGWYVTEIGRQPWLVSGVLKTADAVAPLAAGMVGSTLAMYLALYGVLLAAYIGALFHLAAKAGTGTPVPAGAPPGRAAPPGQEG